MRLGTDESISKTAVGVRGCDDTCEGLTKPFCILFLRICLRSQNDTVWLPMIVVLGLLDARSSESLQTWSFTLGRRADSIVKVSC
mmetsp:Transcript_16243/g.32944  ORF Transcript_16243/g.32944 Transcript_16243/m.32944 type:complete len:85 (+) Transcript_16243:107-361(+)